MQQSIMPASLFTLVMSPPSSSICMTWFGTGWKAAARQTIHQAPQVQIGIPITASTHGEQLAHRTLPMIATTPTFGALVQQHSHLLAMLLLLSTPVAWPLFKDGITHRPLIMV